MCIIRDVWQARQASVTPTFDVGVKFISRVISFSQREVNEKGMRGPQVHFFTFSKAQRLIISL
jgi:hypothetical protein